MRQYENCRSIASAMVGDKKHLSASNEVEARTGWVRQGREAQGELEKTEGRSRRSRNGEGQACGKEREGSSLLSKAWRLSDITILVSTYNYSFPQVTGACANAKFLC